MLGLANVDLAGECLSCSPQDRVASLASTWPLTSSFLVLQFCLFVLGVVVLTFPTECF